MQIHDIPSLLLVVTAYVVCWYYTTTKKTLNILKLTILTGLLFSQSRIQYLNYKSLKSPHNLRVLLVLCWFIIFYIFYIFCFLLFLFLNSQFFIPQETPKQQHKNILSVLFETLNRVQ